MIGYLDCRVVGIFYIVFSVLGGCLGFGFSILMRMELLLPFSVYGDDFYYVCMTSHGVVMVFFFLTTLSVGFSNLIVPGMLNAYDFIFPRSNYFSLCLIFLSFVFLVFSLLLGSGSSTGWTLYVPLSSKVFHFSNSVDFVILSVHVFSLSSLISSLNLVCTVFYYKSWDCSWLDLPVFVWSMIITSFLVIFSLPSLTSVLTMLFLDRNFNCVFFDSSYGGDSLLYQSLFWFWGHPEVYILILPVFGLISTVVCYLIDSNKLLGNDCIIISMLSIGVLGFLVWGHHMVTVGWSLDVRSFFMAATVVISLPTGLKVFSWICSLYFSRTFSSCYNLCYYYVFSFIIFFLVGGVTGVMLSNSVFDVLVHDTYFVVGHFHYILSLAAVSGYFCSFVFFWSSFTGGFKWPFFLGFVHLVFFFISSNVTFFPFHFLGLSGMPRRISCYSDDYFPFFYFSSCGFVFLFFSVFVFFFCIVYSFFNFFSFFFSFFSFFYFYFLFFRFVNYIFFIFFSVFVYFLLFYGFLFSFCFVLFFCFIFCFYNLFYNVFFLFSFLSFCFVYLVFRLISVPILDFFDFFFYSFVFFFYSFLHFFVFFLIVLFLYYISCCKIFFNKKSEVSLIVVFLEGKKFLIPVNSCYFSFYEEGYVLESIKNILFNNEHEKVFMEFQEVLCDCSILEFGASYFSLARDVVGFRVSYELISYLEGWRPFMSISSFDFSQMDRGGKILYLKNFLCCFPVVGFSRFSFFYRIRTFLVNFCFLSLDEVSNFVSYIIYCIVFFFCVWCIILLDIYIYLEFHSCNFILKIFYCFFLFLDILYSSFCFPSFNDFVFDFSKISVFYIFSWLFNFLIFYFVLFIFVLFKSFFLYLFGRWSYGISFVSLIRSVFSFFSSFFYYLRGLPYDFDYSNYRFDSSKIDFLSFVGLKEICKYKTFDDLCYHRYGTFFLFKFFSFLNSYFIPLILDICFSFCLYLFSCFHYCSFVFKTSVIICYVFRFFFPFFDFKIIFCSVNFFSFTIKMFFFFSFFYFNNFFFFYFVFFFFFYMFFFFSDSGSSYFLLFIFFYIYLFVVFINFFLFLFYYFNFFSFFVFFRLSFFSVIVFFVVFCCIYLYTNISFIICFFVSWKRVFYFIFFCILDVFLFSVSFTFFILFIFDLFFFFLYLVYLFLYFFGFLLSFYRQGFNTSFNCFYFFFLFVFFYFLILFFFGFTFFFYFFNSIFFFLNLFFLCFFLKDVKTFFLDLMFYNGFNKYNYLDFLCFVFSSVLFRFLSLLIFVFVFIFGWTFFFFIFCFFNFVVFFFYINKYVV